MPEPDGGEVRRRPVERRGVAVEHRHHAVRRRTVRHGRPRRRRVRAALQELRVVAAVEVRHLLRVVAAAGGGPRPAVVHARIVELAVRQAGVRRERIPDRCEVLLVGRVPERLDAAALRDGADGLERVHRRRARVADEALERRHSGAVRRAASPRSRATASGRARVSPRCLPGRCWSPAAASSTRRTCRRRPPCCTRKSFQPFMIQNTVGWSSRSGTERIPCWPVVRVRRQDAGYLARVLRVVDRGAREDAEVRDEPVVDLGAVLEVEAVSDRLVADVAREQSRSACRAA